MKRKMLNFSLPATMHDFVTDEKDTRFSRGKLNMFYQGTTADGRYFSEDFSKAVAVTAAYAPVVGYYDREKQDFIGHASEQAIYGIVDPKTEPEFVKMDDGNVWATFDVVLYTERPGEVGEIAKKIVGHSQSLELNPSTVEYKINYDEKKHFKNLEFTKGEIIGVSVLGKDQKPAFTGSTFFSNADFEEKMKLLKEYCDNSTIDNVVKGGGEMNPDFMELSWGDISEKVASAIMREYENDGYAILCDTFENHAVICLYYWTGGKKYLDIHYSCTENGEVTLGDVVEVRPTYVQVEQDTSDTSNASATTENPEQQFVEPTNEGSSTEGVTVEETFENTQPTEITETTETVEQQPVVEEQVVQEVNSGEAENHDNFEENNNSDQVEGVVNSDEQQAQVENAEENFADVNQEVSPNSQAQEEPSAYSENVNESKTETKEDSSTSSFTDSKQEELKADQRKQKINLVNEYKSALTDEQFTSFITNIDKYEVVDLSIELLKIYKESQNSVIKGFCNPMVNNNSINTKEDDLGHIVAKVLNK